MSSNEDTQRKRKDSLKAYFVEVIQGKRRSDAGSDEASNTSASSSPAPAPRQQPSRPEQRAQPSQSEQRVTFDSKGNAVWKHRIDTSSPEPGATTVDVLRALENANLAIDNDAEWSDPSGMDPYNTSDD